MKKKIALFVIFIISQLSFGQQYDKSEFIQIDPPPKSSKGWYVLNHSNNAFSVDLKNGKLKITQFEHKKTTELNLKTGKLKGTDRGEWGGKLEYIPSKASEKTIDIKKGNIKFIFQLNNQIYFIEGLAHLSINKGALFKLENQGGDFRYSKVLDFDDAPEALAIKNNKLFIATHSGFCSVDKKLKKKLAFKDMFWAGLYPNSIAVVSEREVYVGMRSGYLKLNLKNKSIKFYKYTTQIKI